MKFRTDYIYLEDTQYTLRTKQWVCRAYHDGIQWHVNADLLEYLEHNGTDYIGMFDAETYMVLVAK